MRRKWTFLFMLTFLASSGLAVYGYQRAQALSDDAELQQQLSVSTGNQFVDTFSGEYIDQEFGQLDRRRALLAQASRWREATLFALVGMVLFGFAAYAASAIEGSVESEHLPAGPLPAPQKA